ncbi:hypothetical protein HJG60_010168 [Phyllostomus discolor]|uniref:Uncharacterized protein n=1 Tax=Phyllostomus discolor TaxID=89673 RepID=A0A834AS92_9CHIR|nr:hypothetical protein HJG60_010168 [Phyllostomus discolor]
MSCGVIRVTFFSGRRAEELTSHCTLHHKQFEIRCCYPSYNCFQSPCHCFFLSSSYSQCQCVTPSSVATLTPSRVTDCVNCLLSCDIQSHGPSTSSIFSPFSYFRCIFQTKAALSQRVPIV